MERSAIEALSYKDLLALKLVVDEVLAAKLPEAEVEYRGRIKGIAQEYGFTLGAALVGKPPVKRKRKAKSNGEAPPAEELGKDAAPATVN